VRLLVETTPLKGLLVITPEKFSDDRGYLAETYHLERYRKAGIDCDFIQDNQSLSARNVLRGLHAQTQKPQAKLARALMGEIFDVAVDARPESPTFGKWYGVTLSDENLRQLFIPKGFLHGFCVMSESALVHYKCSDLYDPTESFGVKWDDPDLAVEWPVQEPRLSPKDKQNMSWAQARRFLESTSNAEKG
jgi:dTDP-4-dehydrorhamnose 3,5-epimerase